MVNKLLITIVLFFLTSCQLQVNIASSVVNIPVVKTQNRSDNATMPGSILEDIAKGAKQKAGDLKLKATP